MKSTEKPHSAYAGTNEQGSRALDMFARSNPADALLVRTAGLLDRMTRQQVAG
jgi:hypothetical protein